jgi:hypothetical protein
MSSKEARLPKNLWQNIVDGIKKKSEKWRKAKKSRIDQK